MSVLFQFALDALSFRTGAYPEVIEPESFAGSYENLLSGEQSRVLFGRHKAIVLGDSSIAEGFSAKLANESALPDGWFFSNGAAPGATPRAWSYLLRDLDPAAHRYNVIVLPLADYADADGIERPELDREADRDIDLNRLIVRIRLTDIPSFPLTWLTPEKRLAALFGCLFKGLVYSDDFREFIRHPKTRVEKAELFFEKSRDWRDEYPGQPSSLEGLRYDPSTSRFSFPAGLTARMRQAIQDRYHPDTLRVDGFRRAYRQRWLGGIIRRYAATGASVVLFRVPTRPVALHVSVPSRGTRFVEMVRQIPGVVILDEQTFADLEAPGFFFDAYHMNAAGRAEFSPRLARAVMLAAAHDR